MTQSNKLKFSSKPPQLCSPKSCKFSELSNLILVKKKKNQKIKGMNDVLPAQGTIYLCHFPWLLCFFLLLCIVSRIINLCPRLLLSIYLLYVLDGLILNLSPATLSYVLMELHKFEFRIFWIIT
jgi:hypothetical protein